MFSQRAQKCLFDIRNPNKTCAFFSLYFFVLLDMVRVHAKAGPWGRPHAAYPIRSFERTFFTLQKNNNFEQRYTGDLYTPACENASEKSAKKLVRGSLLSKEHRDRTKKWKSVTYKSYSSGRKAHRKLHHERDPGRPAPTRQPKKRFEKKTSFFFKKVCFSV